MSYEVRNPEIEAKLRDIGALMKGAMKDVPGYGFALMIFSFGPDGSMFYISNAERDDMIKVLKELEEKLTGEKG
jgi:hypothetical protein